ncbi:MAG: alginate export family protein [Bryobacterales bacterium]|nr:alginate export family protein [Bryobacterales bacterium]
MLKTCSGIVSILCLSALGAFAQRWDLPARASASVSKETGGKLKISAEARQRYERRTGQSFGREPDIHTLLVRNRLTVTYAPSGWLKLQGSVQDSRAPGFGKSAPGSYRDAADLFESYFELFPNRKTGFGLTAGRMALSYGETRLLATANWGNVPRGFDGIRAYWRAASGQVELLWLAPVKIRVGEFNRPVLGERVWGTYNSFPHLMREKLVEFYFLRHEQNRPAGFAGGSAAAGTDRRRIDTFGGRLTGRLPEGLRYSLEGALQAGKDGAATHRAAAWFSALSRRWMLSGKPLDVAAEYKFATGTKDPRNTAKVGAFDVLFPSTHDKFGHMDLFGWRNIHAARSQATFALKAPLTLNLMYDSWWLASERDALYSAAGRAIARSPAGTAGRHVGQELDFFGTYRYRRFTFGAGYGHMFKGAFVKSTTPGVPPTFVYLFHTYSL